MSRTAHHRAAVVGTGHRARMFTRALAERPHHRVAALCDPSPTRMAFHNRLLTEAGEPAATQWEPDHFTDMLAKEDIDEVVVTTVDAEHDRYIVPALRAGCRVVTEKPMTVDAERCARILDTVRATGNTLTVAFNYRFNPAHEKVRALLADGAIGEILSVHFEWLLDVRHGADYFRRWHREKRHSGGLMVHKAGHHFDLVNWWLADHPQEVFGYGRLAFYGREAGERHGLRRHYDRAHGAAPAADDPFALDLAADDTLRALYLDAECSTAAPAGWSSRWRRAVGSLLGSGSPPAAARCTATRPPRTRVVRGSPSARCGGPRSTSRSKPLTRPTAGVTRACSTRSSGPWTRVRRRTPVPRDTPRPPNATAHSRWRSGSPPTGASNRGDRWGCGS